MLGKPESGFTLRARRRRSDRRSPTKPVASLRQRSLYSVAAKVLRLVRDVHATVEKVKLDCDIIDYY
eukprot:4572933-Amphidinium_carterae.1